MPAAIPAIAAGGSIIGSAIGANQAKQAQKGQLGQIQDIFSGLTPEVQGLYGQALNSVRTNYDTASGLLNSYGQTAKTNIATQATQEGANASQDAINHGLGGSSYLQSLHHGIATSSAKAMAGVDEAKAGMLSQLLTAKAGSVASLLTGEAGQTANIGESFANAIGGQQHVATPVNFMPFASAFGGLFGGGGSNQPSTNQDGSSIFG